MRGTAAGSGSTQSSGTAAGSGSTQSNSANRSKGDAMGSPADNQFIMRAAQGGMAEVELGKLAQERGSSDAVKQFGKRMVDDHGKANEELMRIAQSKGVTVSTSLDSKSQSMKDRLSKLNGAAFDRAYMSEMVKDHRTDVAEFQKESNSGRDAEVKAFAAKTLPTLQEHLRMAEEANNTVKGSHNDASTSGHTGADSTGRSTDSSTGSGKSSPTKK
jgi:putative membrane protein